MVLSFSNIFEPFDLYQEHVLKDIYKIKERSLKSVNSYNSLLFKRLETINEEFIR